VIPPELGRIAFRLAMFMVLPAVVLLLFLTPGTAEHSVTVLTLAIGLIFLAGVTLLVRRSLR
jgi:hypothetical protein